MKTQFQASLLTNRPSGLTAHRAIVGAGTALLVLFALFAMSLRAPAQTGWGSALSFDGIDDYLVVTNFGPAAPTNEVTIEFWQRLRQVQSSVTFSLDPDNANNRFLAHVPWGTGVVYWDFGNISGDGRLSWTPSPALQTNVWEHFAMVAKGGTNGYMRIYHNGILKASKPRTSWPASFAGNLLLGRMASPNFFNGELDDFCIWNVARTEAEIQADMGRQLTGAESNLLACYGFDEATGVIASDATTNHFDGTLTNGPTWVSSTIPTAPPEVTTGIPAEITSATANLKGTVRPGSLPTTAWFEWGTTADYGSNTAAIVSSGSAVAPLAQPIQGLTLGTTYHCRLVATNSLGLAAGEDVLFTTVGTNATLVNLVLSAGTLSPPFKPAITNYSKLVGAPVTNVTVTPTSQDLGAVIQVRINGGTYSTVPSGTPSSPLALIEGANAIDVQVTAPDAVTVQTWTITVTLDTTAPVIIACASDRTLAVCAGSQVALPNLAGDVVATDRPSASLVVIQSPPAGILVGLSTNVVTLTVRDEMNNAASCTATIIAADRTPPVFSGPTSLVVTTAPGQCEAPALFSVTATDNCGPAPVVSVPPSGTLLPVGRTNIVSTAVDSAGNTNIHNLSVLVFPGAPSPVGAGEIWVQRLDGDWHCLASSADGNKLVAGIRWDQIYTSTNAGTNWIARATTGSWQSVASSADGTKLVAVESWLGYQPGHIFTSSDSGANWISRGNYRYWTSVASSTNGNQLVAVADNDRIYTSSDSGTNWTARGSSNHWSCVASSADGTKLVAAVSGGQIFTSTDSGATWTARESNRDWRSVASSLDGTRLVAVDRTGSGSGGRIYLSPNSGINWYARETNRFWNCLASSASGDRLLAGVGANYNYGQLYVSPDYGVTWIPRGSTSAWNCVASSWDGQKLAAGQESGRIYTSVPVVVAVTNYPAILGTLPYYRAVPATGPDGAVVTFNVTATNICEPNVPVTCTPPSGSTFPLGYTHVICVAVDPLGLTSTLDFYVHVVPPPTISNLAASVLGTNATSGSCLARLGATVNPNGATTVTRFDYGLTASCPGTVTNLPPVSNSNTWTVIADKLLPATTYHWRVVASNHLGSVTVSDDQVFTVPAVFPPGDTNADGIVDSVEFAAVLANLNGNGIVSQAELDLVLSNYFAHSPWLSLTNTVDAGANLVFALPGSTVGAFSVLTSTNLMDWEYLGPAMPRYEFTDTNAPALPQRFYRLSYP